MAIPRFEPFFTIMASIVYHFLDLQSRRVRGRDLFVCAAALNAEADVDAWPDSKWIKMGSACPPVGNYTLPCLLHNTGLIGESKIAPISTPGHH